jgi:hypothetical protein
MRTKRAWGAFQNQSGLGGGGITSRERKERQISTAVPKGTRSSSVELFRLHHFRGTEIKPQGAMMAEQAVRSDFKMTGRHEMRRAFPAEYFICWRFRGMAPVNITP